MVFNNEVFLPETPLIPRNIGEALKGPQIQFWKESLVLQYDKKKCQTSFGYHTNQIPPLWKNFLRSPISTSISEVNCSDSWRFFLCHSENGSYRIQCIGFDHSYSPVAHSDSFRINIAIADMHRLTARIFDVSNVFQNTNFPIHEIVCVSPLWLAEIECTLLITFWVIVKFDVCGVKNWSRI